MEGGIKQKLFKFSPLGIALALMAVGQGFIQHANAQDPQSRFIWEILVTNESANTIDVTVTDYEAEEVIGTAELDPDESVDMSFSGDYGTIEGDPNTLYTIEIDDGGETNTYLYFYCIALTVDDDDLFFCPNDEGSGLSDIEMIYDDGVRIEPLGLNPGNGNDPDISSTDYFSDDYWIAPYNLDTYCAGASSGCNFNNTTWFLTPQVSTSTFRFTSRSLTQPSNRTWDFNNVTLTFPADSTLTITKGLNINNSVIKFVDDAALIYDGDDDAFNVEAGTTFKLGDDVRFTFESKITLTGTQADPITFEPLAGGDRWDYLDLKDDGNDFDWVVLDGGYKTVEVRSDNNTFDNVTFKNGWRGISSYYSAASGRSSFTLTDCTVEDNSTVGVVAYHTDFSLDDTTVEDNGQAGIWITNATTDTFVDNLVQNNAITSTTRSGIEVNASGIFDTGESAYNVIKNNIYHEISSSSSGQIDAGVSTGGATGGYNDIYDKGTQAAGEKYIYEGSSYDAIAEYNCWDTTGEPSSSLFSGTVDYLPYISCSRASKSAAQASEGKSIRTRIREARDKVVDSSPFYVARDVAYLYVMQQLDRLDILGERAQTRSVIADVSAINTGSLGVGPSAARERAMLIEIQDALSNENYSDAWTLLTSYEQYVKIRSNIIELLLSKIALHEYDASYEKALRVLVAVRLLAETKDGLEPMLEIVEGELVDRIEDETGVRVEARQYAAYESATLRKVNKQVSSEKEDSQKSDLLSVYPNPFNPSTTIPFKLAARSNVSLVVFDLLGRRITVLADGIFEAGRHSIVFEAGDMPSGSYILRFSAKPEQGAWLQISRLISLQK